MSTPKILRHLQALAGKLEYNICVLSLAERGLTDDRLAQAMSTMPPQVCRMLFNYSSSF